MFTYFISDSPLCLPVAGLPRATNAPASRRMPGAGWPGLVMAFSARVAGGGDHA